MGDIAKGLNINTAQAVDIINKDIEQHGCQNKRRLGTVAVYGLLTVKTCEDGKIEVVRDGHWMPINQQEALLAAKHILNKQGKLTTEQQLLYGFTQNTPNKNLPLSKTHKDMIQRPNHYLKNGHECWDTIAVMISDLPPVEAYNVGNIVKYLWRYPKKNGLEDLKKAREYLNRLIMEVEINDFGKEEEKP